MLSPTVSPKTYRLAWGGVTGLSLLVYVITLAPSVLFADGGEFQFVPWLPGIAHPTGYPLYTLLGWLFSHLLPLGEVAWRLNLFSAVTGALAVGAVFAAAFTLNARLWPQAAGAARLAGAGVAALTFAFSRTFWSQAVIAEVYSLHALLVALITGQILRLPPPKSPAAIPRLRLPALLLGLSLTHHSTSVLLFPAVGLYLWLGKYRPSLKQAAQLLLIGALPGLLYLYLPLIAPHVPYARLLLNANRALTLYNNTPAGFWAHITGSVFVAGVQPAALGWERAALSLTFLRGQVGWVGAILAGAGLFHLRKNRPALALTVAGFAGFFIFNLIYFIGDIYVLFIPCWLILSLWIGVGWQGLAGRAAEDFIRRKQARLPDSPIFSAATRRLERRLGRLLTVGLVSVGLLLPLTLLTTRFTEVDQRGNTIARQMWQEIMAQPLPADAILLSNDRNEMMPMWYYQYVAGQQPGRLGLFPLITPDPDMQNVGRALDAALDSGRPVYLIKPMPGLALKADLTPLPPLPHAQLVRARPITQTATQPTNLTFNDELRLTGLNWRQTKNALSVTLFWQPKTTPRQNYTSYIHLLDETGAAVSQSDHQPGGVFYPSSLWSAGETLRDTHTLALPPNLAAGRYTLRTGLYVQLAGGEIKAVGDGQAVGTITLAGE